MAIPDSLLEASLGTLLFLPGSTLATRDGVDYRVRILVLLVALVVAFAATVPDFESAPAASPLVQRARILVSFLRLQSPTPLLQAANVDGLPSTVSSFGIHNCIIELTCSRLC